MHELINFILKSDGFSEKYVHAKTYEKWIQILKRYITTTFQSITHIKDGTHTRFEVQNEWCKSQNPSITRAHFKCWKESGDSALNTLVCFK